MSAPARIFIARLAGLSVFDPIGDQVGKLRDVVVSLFGPAGRPEVRGLVVEVPGRKRIFMPIARVTSMESRQIIVTGAVNLRRFQKKDTEALAIAELLEREVELEDGTGTATVEDLAMERTPRGQWQVTRLFVRRGPRHRGLSARLRRRGETLLVDVDQARGLAGDDVPQGAGLLLATFTNLKAADIAEVLHDMSGKRRFELAAELEDERLADVLEELPEDDQMEILAGLDSRRAGVVLEAMQPDDAADLLALMPEEAQEELLLAMREDEADDVRRLLAYDEDTAGGLMTTDPVVLSPEATVAEALAMVRNEDLSPSLAAAVFVARPPVETPTGRFLGLVHTQRLLREAPHVLLGTVVDVGQNQQLDPEAPLGQVARHLAAYNLVSLPVTDDDGHLVGVVTVDDVLDHLLPNDWRERDEGEDEEDDDG